ncbi:MAG: citrate transporter [Clostridiales bacterium]|nr:citrate transporter [Clostridiales bacterium]
MFLVPPSKEYLGYLNESVLALLFCLMAVVAGFRRSGAFELLSRTLIAKTGNFRALAFVLVLLCFFSSMALTNDVALITFVPLTIGIFAGCDKENMLILIVALETVAANLGSLVTPIGNPQNLFIYDHYHMHIGDFFRVTLPLGGISLVIVLLLLLLVKKDPLDIPGGWSPLKIRKKECLLHGILFLFCILTVLRVVDHRICLAVVLVCLLLFDRKIFPRVDYFLLLTFVAFFIFVGNLSQAPAVSDFLSGLLEGRTMLVSALVSQGISNVPSAVLLSTFTEDVKGLLLGVNIGGLGTLVASLASLISYKFYSTHAHARPGRYLAIFSAVNFPLLAVLLIICNFLTGWM